MKLIFEKGVVQERTDLHPVTGCWRVVYEKQGEGARFLQVLGEEEAFSDERSGLFKKVVYKTFAAGPEYLVYAVSQDRHLMLEFFRRVAHQNQLNHFDLYFKVEYHVSDPKVLVTRLRTLKEDVLDKLRDTIGDEISGASARIPWESIKDEYLFSEVVDDLTDPDRSLFRRLQSKAHDSGLALTDIKLSLRLLEIDVTEPKRDFEHQRDLAQKRRDLSLTQANEDIKDLTKIRELRRQTWEGGTKAITASLEKIADDTDTAAKLRDNLNEIGSAFFPQMNGSEAEIMSLPERSPKMLTESTHGLPGQGLALLQQIFSVVLQLDLRENVKRELLSISLHLAGALLVAGETPTDELAHYRKEYQAILEQFIHELSVPQHNTLELLLNAERL